MKNLALMMIFGVVGVVLSAEEYTIQTISTLKESSITPAFEKKVEKTALPVAKKKEGECNIVTVGHYDTAKKARKDLAKAKKISQDAFVRTVERKTPKACAGTMADQKNEKIVVSDANVTTVVSKNESAVKMMTDANKTIAHTTASAAPTQTPAVLPVEAKAEPCKKETTEVSTAVFVYDRNLARKSDIHEAIEFYENSPYYSFKPIALQR